MIVEKYLEDKDRNIMKNIFDLWMKYYRNRICERNKKYEAIYHYQKNMKKKVLEKWKKLAYKKGFYRIWRVKIQRSINKRILESWLN